jgi:hypothetical protein
MSSRERWIVYPLLFLTLGISLRERSFHMTMHVDDVEARTIRCKQLEVDRVVCGQTVCETMVVRGPNGRPAIVAGVDARTRNGLLEVFASNGAPAVQLQSSPSGGLVTAVSRSGPVVLLGYLEDKFGVFAQLPGLNVIVPLTQQWRQGVGTAIPPPKRGQSTLPSPKEPPVEKGTNPKETHTAPPANAEKR